MDFQGCLETHKLLIYSGGRPHRPALCTPGGGGAVVSSRGGVETPGGGQQEGQKTTQRPHTPDDPKGVGGFLPNITPMEMTSLMARNGN